MTDKTQELQSIINKLENELTEAKEQLEKMRAEKWRPRGTGDYILCSDMDIIKTGDSKNYAALGIAGTKEELIDLRTKFMHLASKHAFARSRDGVQKFVPGQQNWFTFYDSQNASNRVTFNYYHKLENEVYMSRQDAKTYAKMMNKKQIEFSYEGGYE